MNSPTAIRDEHEHAAILKIWPDYDQSFVPIWGDYWSDYSGCGWIVIFDKNGQLYSIEYCYNPENNDLLPEWDPQPISYDDAIKSMLDWEKMHS